MVDKCKKSLLIYDFVGLKVKILESSYNILIMCKRLIVDRKLSPVY